MISYFLGANSPLGFYSLYDHLIDLDRAEAVYILKGGPGCGKSTFLRRVAGAAEKSGLAVEYIRCSGDPDSLDAVVIPDRGIALADGTAPHIMEPRLPGAVDHYIDLGVCYDSTALAPLRHELLHTTQEYKNCYERAYRCLSAAADVERDCRCLPDLTRLDQTVARRLKGILAREFRTAPAPQSSEKKRFLSAVTCKGHLCLWETVQAQCPRVYVLEDSFGLSDRFLLPLYNAARAIGFSAVVCPSPMDPDRLEHLLFPDLGLAFVTSSPELPYSGKVHRRIRLDSMIPSDSLRLCRPRLRFARKVSSSLLGEAVSSLKEAKTIHDRLEALYNPHVDFALGTSMADKLIQTLAF